jgi:hypothetical protein
MKKKSPQGNRSNHPTKLTADVERSIVKEFQGGVSAAEIGRLRGLPYSLIINVLRRHGEKPGKNEVHLIPNRLDSRKNEVLTFYETHNGKATAKHFGVSEAALSRFLKLLNVVMRFRGPSPDRFDHLADEIVQRWIAGETKQSIAQTYNIHKNTVTKILWRHCPKDKLAPGPQHWKWKGGRKTDGNGYIVVPITESHPFFETMHYQTGRPGTRGPGSKLIMEHRLVMAEHLGRPLTHNETVHHVDGNRRNNVITNLQLRISDHGPGIVLRCRKCGSHDLEALPIADLPIEQTNKVADDSFPTELK